MKVFLLSLKFCSACGVQQDREHCLENHLPGRAASLAQVLGLWFPPPTPKPQLPSECGSWLEESAQARWCETLSGLCQGRVLTVGTIKETGE